MILKILNKKKINILNGFVEKAYVEGIYADTPQNRKLGRVGMSYIEYAKMIKDRGEKENTEPKIKREKKEKPESIQDLTFKNIDGKKIATYSIGDTSVKIEIVSEEKYKDKQYKMIVYKEGEREFEVEGNAAKVARQMKLLANDQPFKHEIKNFRDILPLTSEELDEKWGRDYGFTYTYFKDDLDITVWRRDDDKNSKDPHFNIYVKNIKNKKQKKYLNLSLKSAHEKLLEFDLNPNVDSPLTKEQLKEKNRILSKEGSKNEEELEEEEMSIKPSKDIGVKFNKQGQASFINEKNNTALKISVNPNDSSQLTIHSYIIDKDSKNTSDEPVLILAGIGTTSVDNFKEYLENYDLYEDISSHNQVERTIKTYLYEDKKQREPKDIVESYGTFKDLLETPGIFYITWDRAKAEKDPNVIQSIKSKNFNPKFHRFNKGKINVIEFVKSGALDKWLSSLPSSNKGIKKEEISRDINNKVDRMKYNSEGFRGIYDLVYHILYTYY